MTNVTLVEIDEKEKILAHFWNIIDSIQVPMYQNNDEYGTFSNFNVTLAYCQDRILALFNNETPAKLIAATRWDPPTLWRGPAYNQLIIDTIFSTSNLLTFSATVQEMGKARQDMFTLMKEQEKNLSAEIRSRDTLLIQTRVKLLNSQIEIKKLTEQIEVLRIAASAVNGSYNEKEYFEIDL